MYLFFAELLILLAALFRNACAEDKAPKKQPPIYANALYFTNWGIYVRNYQPADLPTSDISHLLYAFLDLDSNGTVFSTDTYADLEKHYPDDSWSEVGQNAYGCVKQLYRLKLENRHLKTMLSIGGSKSSTNFSIVAAYEPTRKTFAKSAVTLMKDWGFDGIDVDWESPTSTTDADNMILLLQAVRDELDAYSSKHANGYPFQLSIAAPAGPEKYGILKLDKLGALVDHINLMAYDYFNSHTTSHQDNLFPDPNNPNATLFSTDVAVKAYLVGGVPPNKLRLGMPLYGRGFVGTDGLGKDFTELSKGDWEVGIFDYKSLPKSGAMVELDSTACATYSWDPITRELVTFDDPFIVKKKAKYIKDRGLGGAMFWEASGDRSGAESLVITSKEELGTIDQNQNCLSYPDSQYENIAHNLR